jgi:hypothetical protein
MTINNNAGVPLRPLSRNIRISSNSLTQSFKEWSQIEAQYFDMEIPVYGSTLSHKRPNLLLLDVLGPWLSEDLNNFFGLLLPSRGIKEHKILPNKFIHIYRRNRCTFSCSTEAEVPFLQRESSWFTC